MEKMTVSEKFMEVVAFLNAHNASSEMVSFVEQRMEQHEKKLNGSSAKKEEEANKRMELALQLEAYLMTKKKSVTIREITKELEGFEEFSSSKVVSLLGLLGAKVTKEKKSGIQHYSYNFSQGE